MSPIAVKLRCSSAPTFPITAGPLFTPTRKRGHSGRPWATASDASANSSAARAARMRMIGLVGGCVEDDHHGVAREALDHPVLGRDDGNDLGPVRVQHRDHLRRRRALREGREALEIGEEDADLPLLAAELARTGLLAEPVHQLRREVRAEELVEPPQLAGGLLEQLSPPRR